MKQVVQKIGGGPVEVIDTPLPIIGATEVLVRTEVSAISPGTERASAELAQASLLGKARARPDLVRQVIDKARSEGLRRTADAVRTRLDGYIPLGYSGTGIAVEVGEAVAGIRPGDRVATGGAGKASHAEYQAVPGLLCAPVPPNLAAEEAAFSTILAIAIHAVRQAGLGLSDRVAVIGMGLIGRLTARCAVAAGCRVIGIDLHSERSRRMSDGVEMFLDSGESTDAAIASITDGMGLDAVLVAAASETDGPVTRAAELCRKGGRVIVIGDVKLNLDRRLFYEKELDLRISRSYGPGRYEPSYEQWGVDLPMQYVRWTEGRNISAAVELLASGRVAVGDLITDRYAIADAAAAYENLKEKNRLGIIINYTAGTPKKDSEKPQHLPRKPSGNKPRLGMVGAGSFATSVLLPALLENGADVASVASATGLGAQVAAKRFGIRAVAENPQAILDDPSVDTVVISTPHDSHAELTIAALQKDKNVFCEKPLALTLDELSRIEEAWRVSGRVLFVGFNRRWSKSIVKARDALSAGEGPLVVSYRVNAGSLPDGHWYRDRRQGGRLIGEGCHFVDTCLWLVGATPVQATAAGGGKEELMLSNDFVIHLRFDDGSLASITYGSGGSPRTAKERIEVLGRGKTVVIDDFKSLEIDGKAVRHQQDKGHNAEIQAFLAAAEKGDSALTDGFIASMRATLEAAAALRVDGPRGSSS